MKMKKPYDKASVKDHWEEKTCGEVYMGTGTDPYEPVRASRYTLIPELPFYADFPSARDRDVLEIGVGVGTDFGNWLKHEPKTLTGVDLTDRAVEHPQPGAARRLLAGVVEQLHADADAQKRPAGGCEAASGSGQP